MEGANCVKNMANCSKKKITEATCSKNMILLPHYSKKKKVEANCIKNILINTLITFASNIMRTFVGAAAAGERGRGTAMRTEEGGRWKGPLTGPPTGPRTGPWTAKNEWVFQGFSERYTGRSPSKKLIPPFATTIMTPGSNAARVPQRWSCHSCY